MSKKIVPLSVDELAVLDSSYPVAEESNRLTFPRLGMLSKDLTEETGKGKAKTIKVIESAGTFYTEKDNGETDPETGKKIWTKEFIGDKIEVVIAYERKQLRKFDASLKKFISTPLYDTADQVLPLYLDKQVIKRGTPEQLQSLYPALTAKGKKTSDLKEECILFVLYEGEMYQMTLSQSSKWAFKDYKKNVNPSKVLTLIGSVEETFGTNAYQKMTFKNQRFITQEEFDSVVEGQTILKDKAQSDAQYLLANANAPIESSKDAELEAIAASGNQKF